MIQRTKRRFADVPPGAQSPLDFAVERNEQNVISLVQDAIARKRVLLAYQPVVRSDTDGRTAFYEGLVRVLDPTGRIIPARHFIGAVETTETGRNLDVVALRTGLMALHQNPGLRLSINMSARSIGYKRWTEMLHRWLRRDPTIGERLILEITETSAMLMPELVVDFMEHLQPKGICFALDDFGAGYTAIRYFKDFFFDILKIDGQFIKGISANPDNIAVTTALVSIARHFDMVTVAECVETAEDAAMLSEMGVDCLQGYHFAAPTTRPPWLAPAPRRAAG